MLPRQFQWLTRAQDPAVHIKETSLQSGPIQLQPLPAAQRRPKRNGSVKSPCMTLNKLLIGLRASKEKNSPLFIQLRFSPAFLPVVCLANNNIQNQVTENFLFFPLFKTRQDFPKNGSVGKTFFTFSFNAKDYLIFTGAKWQPETKPNLGHCVAFHCCNGLKMATSRAVFSGERAAQLPSPCGRQSLHRAGTLRPADERTRGRVHL